MTNNRVYEEAALNMINGTKTLSVLFYRLPDMSLPSWVPNWHQYVATAHMYDVPGMTAPGVPQQNPF